MRRAAPIVALVAAAVAAVASAAAAPSRDALLRPGVGAGKLRLGMTFAQARATLGKPDRIRRPRPYPRPRVSGEYVEYEWGLDPAWKVGVLRRAGFGGRIGARVVVIETTRPERTRAGVGIGSTRLALQRALRTRCYKPPPSPLGPDEWPGYPLPMWCYHGNGRGRPVTVFHLTAECAVPTDRYRICPKSKRTYVAHSVWIASEVGKRIWSVDDSR